MMRRVLSLAAISLLAVSATASAQGNAQLRDGFTLSFGLGGGSAALTCSGCPTSSRETGPSGYLRIGGAVSQNLVLAGESNGWAKKVDGIDTQIGDLSFIAQWYPSATGGFFLKGGLGAGAYSEKDASGNKLESVGLTYQTGAGYDVRLGHSFSLTPYVNYLGMRGNEATLNGTNTGVKPNLNDFQYGLGLTWH